MKPEIKAWKQTFISPKEREEFLMNLAISSQFGMRYRGLLQFYGKELIAFKLEYPKDEAVNEFLRVLSKFMTDALEEHLPISWKQCDSSFWEELIYTFFPLQMKITPHEKETEIFLQQLKKFVRWLDKRVKTHWYPVVDTYSDEAFSVLKTCERLLNNLFLSDFPLLHHKDWNLEQDYEKIQQKFDQFSDRLSSIFEVTSKIENTIVLTEFETNLTYYISGLPSHLIEPGLIMSGSIGRKKGVMVWNWYETDSIFPQRGKKYIQLKK